MKIDTWGLPRRALGWSGNALDNASTLDGNDRHHFFRASLVGAVLMSFPLAAHAQHIPGWLVMAALSPVAVILLAIVLGILTRSLRAGVLHVALVLLWVVTFGITAYYVTNDYIIWTPLVLYGLHAILLVVLILWQIVIRFRRRKPVS